jgi:hypothetical protein
MTVEQHEQRWEKRQGHGSRWPTGKCVCGATWPCAKADKFPRQSWLAIEAAEAQREDAVRKHLTISGWQYTSDTSSCVWLWQKQLEDGRVVLCDERTAIVFQEHYDSLVLDQDEDQIVEG